MHGVISRKARQRPEAEHHGIDHKGVPAIHEGSEGSCGKTISPFAAEFIFCSVNGEDRRTKKFHLIGKFIRPETLSARPRPPLPPKRSRRSRSRA